MTEERPEIIKHLISIGFDEIVGFWKPKGVIGEGSYWQGILKRGNDTIITDRETTCYGYALNGDAVTEEYLMALIVSD